MADSSSDDSYRRSSSKQSKHQKRKKKKTTYDLKKKSSKKKKSKYIDSDNDEEYEMGKLFSKFYRYMESSRLEKMSKCHEKFMKNNNNEWEEFFVMKINQPVGSNGCTYLHKSASVGNLAIFKFLYYNGADVRKQDKRGLKKELFSRHFFNTIKPRYLFIKATLMFISILVSSQYLKLLYSILEFCFNIFNI